MLRLVRQGVGRKRRFRSEFIAREGSDPGKGAPLLSLTARSSLDASFAGGERNASLHRLPPRALQTCYHRLGGDGLDPDWIAASGGNRSSGRGEAAGETEAHLSCLPTVQSCECWSCILCSGPRVLETDPPPTLAFCSTAQAKV